MLQERWGVYHCLGASTAIPACENNDTNLGYERSELACAKDSNVLRAANVNLLKDLASSSERLGKHCLHVRRDPFSRKLGWLPLDAGPDRHQTCPHAEDEKGGAKTLLT